MRSDDYWWLHGLKSARSQVGSERGLRQEGVDARQAVRGVELIVKVVTDDGPQTRAQLRQRLDTAGASPWGRKHATSGLGLVGAPLPLRARSGVTTNGVFRPVALVGGRVVATWGLPGGRPTIAPLEPLSARVRRALSDDGADVLRFLGLPQRPAQFDDRRGADEGHRD